MAEEKSADIVLVKAPVGADAANICRLLLRAKTDPRVCNSVTMLRKGIEEECSAIILTEEAVESELTQTFAEVFAKQPPWSDVPIILIASMGMAGSGSRLTARLSGPRRTVTLLERPLRAVTLLATVQAVLSARRRQYEVRDLLHERDAILTSLESRVADRTAALKQMVEEMEAFSYSVSHDLRSPLRSLDGYARALLEDYGDQLPSGAKVYLDKIASAAQRMDGLTQDVLAYTRVSRRDMELVPVDLDALVGQVISQYPAVEAVADCILVRRPLGFVLGHAPSLVQIFSNLLGNAAKFIPPERVPRIDVWSTVAGGRRRVFIRDNGVGIRPADHERVFRMFERAAPKQVPGTGIGLAIVKKAAERMCGSTGLSSTPGEGAEFWFELADVPPSPRAEDVPSSANADKMVTTSPS